MPKTLADGRIKVVVFTTKPTGDLTAITATVANAQVPAGDISCRVLKSDYRISATGSDTVADSELCSDSNAVTYGASNYEGSVTPFRYLTTDGLADAANDIAWDLLKEKGTTLWFLEREGPETDAAFATGQDYDLYEVITDEPQVPGDRGGFVKRVVPLGVQRRWSGTIAAGA